MNEKRWAFAGKILVPISLIIGITLGGAQLIDRLKTPTVIGIVEYRKYDINPKLRDMIEAGIEKKTLLNIIKSRRQNNESPNKIIKAIEDIALDNNSDYFLPLDLRFDSSDMIIFYIKNDSTSLARQVRLILPGEGQAEIKEPDVVGSTKKRVEWSEQILLGDIRPKGNLEVRIWPKDFFYIAPNPAIVYAGGMGEIMQLQKFYGWDADLASWFLAAGRYFQVGVVVSFLAVILAIFWFASRRGHITINLRKKDKETT